MEAKKEQERIANFKKEAKLPKKPQVVLSQHPEGKLRTISNGSAGTPPALGTFQRLRGLPAQAGSSAESARPSQAVDSDPGGTTQLTPAPEQPLMQRRHPRRSEKLFIRLVLGGIILFLLFNAVAFGFWYFFQKEAEPRLEPTSEQVEEPTLAEPTPPPPPQPEAGPSQAEPPISFFEAPEQELLIESPGELLSKLQDFLGGVPALGFTNLAVKTQGDILSLKDFLQGAEITIPQELKGKLAENLMLFSYVAEDKKRLGFVAKLKETEGVSGLLQSWEQSNMEQDLASFFDIIERKGSAYTPFFRSATYQGVQVRFQTFSVTDFGIVYGVLDNKLLLTSSFESFQRAVDQLKASRPEP